MDPRDVAQCTDAASRMLTRQNAAARAFGTMDAAKRAIDTQTAAARALQGENPVARACRTQNAQLNSLTRQQRDAMRAFSQYHEMGHGALGSQATARIGSVRDYYPSFKASGIFGAEFQRLASAFNAVGQDLTRKILLDFGDLAKYVMATGTFIAPNDKATVVLTYKDRRRCPYLGGLLRENGWQVIELAPWLDVLHLDLHARQPELELARHPVARGRARAPCRGRQRRDDSRAGTGRVTLTQRPLEEHHHVAAPAPHSGAGLGRRQRPREHHGGPAVRRRGRCRLHRVPQGRTPRSYLAAR